MEYVKLNNGVTMPVLGFGVFQIPDLEQCESCVIDAIEVGYRLIDTAASYMNEEAVGKAIKKSNVPREDFFVTTKLWIQSNGYDGTMKAFDESMKKLQLDYLDLYLIHQPYGDVYGEWKAMEELYKQGKIRAIGVCNFHPDRLMDLIVHNEVMPAVNQIELNPFHQQYETQQFLIDNNIQLQSWAPFVEGKHQIFENEILGTIAKKYNKTIAQVSLKWQMQRGIIAIPKSIRKERMAENFDVFDFELTIADMESIKLLDQKLSSFFDHRDPAMVKWLAGYKPGL